MIVYLLIVTLSVLYFLITSPSVNVWKYDEIKGDASVAILLNQLNVGPNLNGVSLSGYSTTVLQALVDSGKLVYKNGAWSWDDSKTNPPTIAPTIARPPTVAPTVAPTITLPPTIAPTNPSTIAPNITLPPTIAPTVALTNPSTIAPNITRPPTIAPTIAPNIARPPTIAPTIARPPTNPPTIAPNIARPPTNPPTIAPTNSPTISPTIYPTIGPTVEPDTLQPEQKDYTQLYIEIGVLVVGLILVIGGLVWYNNKLNNS